MTLIPASSAAAAGTNYRLYNVAVGPSVGTEVDVMNQTIPANTLGAGGRLTVVIDADWFNNSGSNQGFTLRVYFGGVKLYDSNLSTTAASGTTHRAMRAILDLMNLNATNANKLVGTLALGSAAGVTTGFGALNNAPTIIASFGSADQTIDTTADQVFRVTVQLGASDANLSLTVKSILAQVL